MKYLCSFLAVLLLALTYVNVTSAQGGYSPDQWRVIAKIYYWCDYYGADCTEALAIARRETSFGATRFGDYNVAGVACSRGVYQWFAGWGNNCVNGGAACSGEYYRLYGLTWRENEDLDIRRAVEMITSYQRGGPDYRSAWWTPKGLNIWGLPGRPAGYGGGPPMPTATPTPEPEPLPELPKHKLTRLELWEE